MVKKNLTQGNDAFAWTPAQVLAGLDGDDTILGLAGNDTINGVNGANLVFGGLGDDGIYTYGSKALVTPGVQTFYGGGGNDELRGGELNDRLAGDGDSDTLMGEGGDDTMYGGDGNDVIYALSGNYLENLEGPLTGRDLIFGGAGDDLIYTLGLPYSAYTAVIYGGVGDDEIGVGGGANQIYGGEGADEISAYVVSDADQPLATYDGGSGTDRLALFIGDQKVGTSSGDQVVVTRDGADFAVVVNGTTRASVTGFENLTLSVEGDSTLVGSSGNDIIGVANGDAKVAGGSGFDRVEVTVGSGPTVGWSYDLDGGAGRDRLVILGAFSDEAAIRLDMRGTTGVIQTGDGPEGRVTGFELFTFEGSMLGDVAYLGAENDVITEEADQSGADDYHGRGGDDKIFSGAQNDMVFGDAGNDTLNGESGDDLIRGGTGDDVVTGGAGADKMYGEAGKDVFVFAATDSDAVAGQIDNIFGFTSKAMDAAGADKIDLSALGDLTFIGTQAFGAAGQVRLQQETGGTFVLVNLLGSTGAEMKIALVDVTASDLAAGDFSL